MNNYQLLRDAYFGSGGFASGAYLTKHKRESEEDYRFRRQNAYYLNYFAPIVNALVDPIFKHPCRFTIDVLQMIKKYTVTPFCVIVKVPPKTIDRRNRI